MTLLTRDERQALTDLLLQLPNSSDAAARRLLLADLPSGLEDAIEFANAPAIHIANIVNTVTDPVWEQLPDNSWPVFTVIENAIYQVRGSRIAAQLQSLLATLQARAAAGGAAGERHSSPASPLGSTPAGRAAGGVATDDSQHGGARFGDNTQVQGNVAGGDIIYNYYGSNPAAGPTGGQPSGQAPSGDPKPAARAAGQPIQLDRTSRLNLYKALIAACPTLPDLARMVRFGLDENQAVIAGGDSVSTVAFNLIQWAESRGRVADLITAAVGDNPSNADLQAIARQYGLA